MNRLFLMFLLVIVAAQAPAQTTAFTYQGRLNANGAPGNGTYDLLFTIYASATGINDGFANQTNAATVVSNGLFTATLDFGPGIFTGEERWLEIAVRPSGSGTYTNLSPRQRITATPYAITASKLTGVIQDLLLSPNVAFLNASQIFTGQNTFNHPANAFTGNGSALSALNASQLTSGTVADARLSSSVSLLGPSIDSPEIANGAIKNQHIDSASNISLLGQSISSSEITDGTIMNADINSSAEIADTKLATISSAGKVADSALSANIARLNQVWRLGGNAGTTPGSHFLGTTDNQPLTLRVNNTVALEIRPAATVPNIVGGLAAFAPSVIADGVSGAVIAGGNAPSGGVSGEGAGDFHAVYDNDGVVGGGFGNKVGSDNGDITDGAFATVAGGVFNTAANYAATVAGGDGNFAAGQRSFIGGGYANQAQASFSVAGGGLLNSISANADYATIGGGDNNSIGAFSTYGTIGGGSRNAIVSDFLIGMPGSTVSGGTSNSIRSFDSTIGGGLQNIIEPGGYRGAIGGGEQNTIQNSAGNSTIAGGFYNTIGTNAGLATIGGGGNNRILPSGQGGTIPGGYLNSAASFAFAAGFRAKANHPGSFVWADSQNADFSSTANNQFNIRAQGGVRLNTDTGVFFGNQTRQMLNLWGTEYGIGVQNSAAYFRSDQEFMWYRRGSHSDAFGDPGPGGTQLMRLGINGELIIAGTLSQGSDRHIKQGFTAVNPQEVLEKVTALPIQTWTYTNDASRRHLGPVAQDFHAAFGLNGSDDKHIAAVDADGVALAAIQGLNQKLDDTRAELKRRDTENVELKQRLMALEKLVTALTQK